MTQRRWLRIIPVALIMYTISYIDRTNVSLALDPNHSTMMKDLLMDDKMKGEAAGIFFFGYLLLQIPGGWLASRWSARKLIGLCLIAWGACAIGCGLAQTFRQFEVMRVLLGVAEGTVKSRCHRARMALRAALAEQQSGPDTTARRREAWGTS